MRNLLFLLLSVTLLISCDVSKKLNHEVIKSDLRAPAYPLISIDPYTSGWSFTDNLYDGSVKHWTGKNFPLVGAVKVDNKVYRFMGTEDIPLISVAPTAEHGGWTGKYTNTKPADNWLEKDFNDNSWKEGPGAFGSIPEENTAKTLWNTEFIWVRRVVNLEEDLAGKKVFIEFSH